MSDLSNKTYTMETEFELIAKTFQGLENVLAKELTDLGANNIQTGRRMVSFTGDKELMYRANFALRTAIRILKPIKHFKAESADQVYDAVKAIDWNQYLNNETSFAVDSVVFSQEFRHSKFVAYKVKDAIVDYFREKTGSRPNISVTHPDLQLNIHIAENDCTLSLDSSGESLHRRGYRQEAVEAPLNEVLAAGMILMTGCYNMQAPDGSMIFEGLKGVEAGPVYTQAAIDQLMPGWGGPFIAITIFFFAFTTILGYYYMAETNMAYLNRYIRKPVLMSACKAIFIGTVAFGAINSSTLIWTMADVGVGTMAWLNLIAIMLLQKPAFIALKDYERQLKDGLNPVFHPEQLGIVNATYWEGNRAEDNLAVEEESGVDNLTGLDPKNPV